MSRLARISLEWRERGPAGAAAWAAGRALAGLARVRRLDVLERDLERGWPSPKGSRAVLREVGLAELEGLRGRLEPWGRWRRTFEERLRRGHACLACLADGQVAGWIWIAEGPERDRAMGLTVRPAPDQTYGFDLYVLPEHRSRAMAYELVAGWLDFSRRRGKKTAVGVVEEGNGPMQMTVRIVFGFRTSRKVRALQLLGRYGVVFSERPAGVAPRPAGERG